VRGEVVVQKSDDRDGALAFLGLRFDLSGALVPRAGDVDDPGREVDVLPPERPQFAAPESGVERRRVDRAEVVGERGEKVFCLGDGGGTVTWLRPVRQPEGRRRVDVDLLPLQGVPVDPPHGQDHVPHARAGHSLPYEPVDERSRANVNSSPFESTYTVSPSGETTTREGANEVVGEGVQPAAPIRWTQPAGPSSS